MNKFKIGDRVMCIEDEGSVDLLKLNEVYTVIRVDHAGCVYLKGFSDKYNGWSGERFKLWNPCEDILQNVLDN